MDLRIKNREARWLWLGSHGLTSAPTGPPNVLDIITKLGFVQIDSIRNVTRAHHHILWTRNQNYREHMLWHELTQKRSVFEHFTHDASIIPMEFYPMWGQQFRRMKTRLQKSKYYSAASSLKNSETIKSRIEKEGALSTHAFDSKIVGKKAMWSRPPHKLALDYLWYIGELTTARRENFNKYYDLAERVIPPVFRIQKLSSQAQIDALCFAALTRLGFATLGDIQRFWGAMGPAEVKHWAEHNKDKIIPVDIQSADGSWQNMLAMSDIKKRLSYIKPPTSRLRIINPFDPAIRDRKRLHRLFGFEYKIEIFVPAAKRKWGYYVYPILEASKFVGRIEIKANRKEGVLRVVNFWPEPGINWTKSRSEKLTSELRRFARLIAADRVLWQCAEFELFH